MLRVSLWWRLRAMRTARGRSRLSAIESFIELPAEEAFEDLLACLEDADPEIRAAAAEALGVTRDVRAASALIQRAMREKLVDVIKALIDALKKIDDAQTPQTIARFLNSDDIHKRQTAASLLMRYGMDQLSGQTRARVAIVRTEWDEAIEEGEEAIGPLCDALKDGSLRVQRDAAAALGAMKLTTAADALVTLLRDKNLDPSTIDRVAHALREFYWYHIEDEHKAYVAVALGQWAEVRQLGRLAFTAVEEAFTSRRDIDFTEAADVLTAIDDRKVRKVFEEVLSSTKSRMEATAVAARHLAVKCEGGVEMIAKICSDRSKPSTTREVAAMVLAEVGDHRSLDMITPMLDDPDPATRQWAVWTLERIGWVPKTLQQRIAVLLAYEDWEGLVALGASAVEPLIEVAIKSEATNEAISTIERIVECEGNTIPQAALRKLAALGKPRACGALLTSASALSSAVGARESSRFLRIRNLAGRELNRRVASQSTNPQSAGSSLNPPRA